MRLRVRFCIAVCLGVLALGVLGSGQVALAKSPDPSHPARHGIVWERGKAPAFSLFVGGQLTFGGGNTGVGVTTGPPKVYLVVWGSQWGTEGTNGAGNVTFSGDPSGEATDVEAFMKGLGTGGETWSGVMTQYCEGVATGSSSCPTSNTSHVGYPTGGAFAGIWYDNGAAAPTQATENQLAQEAVNAASQFGNASSTANRSALYVVMSPHDTFPDGYNAGANWCAWHDYSADPTLTGGPASSTFGPVAFTNLPYITDTGASCGANFNGLGSNAGITIVEGHEYAETITDQYPAGGWTDSSGSENGDKCAWISSGQGAAANLTLTTGTYPVQSTWANDYNSNSGGCELSHPIVSNGTPTNDFSVAVSPSSESATQGSSTPAYTVSTTVTSGSSTSVTLSASGLPSGATASFGTNPVAAGNGTTMTIGTSSTTPAGTYTITVTGNNGSTSHSATTSLIVNAASGSNPVVNGGFETGSLSGWTASGPAAGVSTVAHSGTYSALLGSTRRSNGSSSIAQTFTVPSGVTTLTFWFDESCVNTSDYATVTLKDNTTGTTTTVWKTCTTAGWTQVTYNLTAFIGHNVTLTLTNRAKSDATRTYFDDVAIA